MSNDLEEMSRPNNMNHFSDDPKGEDSGRITVIGLQSAKPVQRPPSLGVADAWKNRDWERTHSPNPSTTTHTLSAPGREEKEAGLEEEGGKIADWIVPQTLAKVLECEPNFCATQRRLQQQLKHSFNAMTRTVYVYGKTFHLNKDVVELRPQLTLCEDHISEDGCLASQCLELHICPQYVERSCDKPHCGLGHEWHTDHNRPLLQDFYLDELNISSLHYLFDCTLSNGPFGPPDICNDYNDLTIGCRERCVDLHICRTFVKGLARCVDDNCSLSHAFTDSHNQWLLKIHGVPANETPRDIVMDLVKLNPALIDTPPLPSPTPEPDPSESSSSGTSDSEDSDDGARSSSTQWSHYPCSDTQIPAICEASVMGLCSHEDDGCSRLHATVHYHWQVSEDCIIWHNLCQHQVDCLERSYCDPQQWGETLPLLKPRAMEPWWMKLLDLLGSTTWLADFKKMQLVFGERLLHLRRLCTEGGANVWAASTFLWYRKLNEDQWQEYSQDQGEDLVSNINSEDIEKKWQEDPKQTIVCPGSLYNISIDFETMIETVSGTQNQRQLRRRPKPHLGNNLHQRAPWQLLDMATFHDDYCKVESLLNDTATRYSSITIKKIDNFLLRRDFQKRLENLEQQSQGTVKVRQLFQAVDPALLSVICAGNFDWRHQHKLRSSLKYGRGCYFYTSARNALKHGPAPSHKMQRLLVARVAVSSWTQGDVTMVAPPFIPNTGTRHDATTDDPDHPTVFVKYHPHDYHPEYLVILQ